MADDEHRVGRTPWDFATEVVKQIGIPGVLVIGVLAGGMYYFHKLSELQVRADETMAERLQLWQRNSIDLAERASGMTTNLLENISSTMALTEIAQRERDVARTALAETQYARTEVLIALNQIERLEDEVNKFIDRVYRPAFIEDFATEVQLDETIRRVVESTPGELLPGVTAFVRIALERIEEKRRELMQPILTLKSQLDTAARQTPSADQISQLRKTNEILDATVKSSTDVVDTPSSSSMETVLRDRTKKLEDALQPLNKVNPVSLK